ncbi:ATP-binding cassette domain-containing protein [Shewanella saliphila]|nr:ATP-binding cassette domain-containing protein [Shewanella saliphila]MCL1102125.1 ATP-binding cassette domain-containing protein [Shewanella saliphila]
MLLKNLNLTVSAGESIAITGPSGSGKSTLMKIMLGLMPPTSGKILFDGKDITQLGLKNYRKVISAELQNDTLFAGSVLDNITFFDTSPNLLKVEKVASYAAIHGEIECMTMGYNSLVGDMGSCLSGGQLQRVLLARALYREPSILFMDEATSHLDKGNESRISEQVARLNMTRVCIAHRQETLSKADTIYELSNGVLSTVGDRVVNI